MTNKQYSKPQVIKLGDAVKSTLGSFFAGTRDNWFSYRFGR